MRRSFSHRRRNTTPTLHLVCVPNASHLLAVQPVFQPVDTNDLAVEDAKAWCGTQKSVIGWRRLNNFFIAELRKRKRMLVPFTGTGLFVVSAVVMYHIRARVNAECSTSECSKKRKEVTSRTPLTVIDVHSVAEAVSLLKRISRSVDLGALTTERISTRLVDIYRCFHPREQSMRLLSIEQQRLSGTGGEEEYAVCTVLSAMMIAINESSQSSYVHKRGGCMDDAAIYRRSSDGSNSASAPSLRIAPGSKSM